MTPYSDLCGKLSARSPRTITYGGGDRERNDMYSHARTKQTRLFHLSGCETLFFHLAMHLLRWLELHFVVLLRSIVKPYTICSAAHRKFNLISLPTRPRTALGPVWRLYRSSKYPPMAYPYISFIFEFYDEGEQPLLPTRLERVRPIPTGLPLRHITASYPCPCVLEQR
ncbi:hypothetical protein B0H21DRAFT_747137 [Amylocystis lapponica]|nr:hypothetical protein B0H21DRAFT_747137 [Amylocystis lapponica]